MVIAAIDLGDLLWTLLVIYLAVNVLIGIAVVVVDLVHSKDVSGIMKAVWMLALIALPLIALLVYLVARGDGIGERRLERQGPPSAPPAGYAAAPATELKTAKDLHADGTLSPDEYDKLKQRILG